VLTVLQHARAAALAAQGRPPVARSTLPTNIHTHPPATGPGRPPLRRTALLRPRQELVRQVRPLVLPALLEEVFKMPCLRRATY
jgi:hypothetical protein